MVNIFEKHDFDREEAIELAEAINGKSGLATKEDIYEVKEEIAEVRREMVELRSELKEDIAQNAKSIEKLSTSLKWIQIVIGLSFAVITTLLGVILAVGLGGV